MLNLSHILTSNKLLASYIIDSNVAINNLLRGKVSNGTLDRIFIADTEETEDEQYDTTFHLDENYIHSNHFKDFIKSGYVFTEGVPYNPITPQYITQLIELDAALRASKTWNTKPITVYRGCNDFNTNSFNEMLSTSTEKEIALIHGIKQNGVILKINLPANFPYIEPTKYMNWNAFDFEYELLLPPCNLEIVGEWSNNDPMFNKLLDKNLNIKFIEVNLYPKSLAKVFLKRLKKMPADYPQEFISNPMFEFNKARNLLQSYVRNYVDKEKIPLPTGVINELKSLEPKQKQ